MVTDAMVDAACEAYEKALGLGPWSELRPSAQEATRTCMRSALEAADRARDEGATMVWRNPAPDAAAPGPAPGSIREFMIGNDGVSRERPPRAGKLDLPDDR